MELEENKGNRDIKAEELQLYDRQRFIGVEVQRRLINSKVFISPLNGINTELAKNLILCGANISIFDNEKINQDDIETNFLIGPNDLNKNRGQHIYDKLTDMNPMAKIEIFNTFNLRQFYEANIKKNSSVNYQLSLQDLSQYTILAFSTKDFEEMSMLDEISKTLNKPFYNLLCCGLYGFFYVSLGNSFTFTEKKSPINKVLFQQGKTIIIPPEFEEYFDGQLQGISLQQSLKPNQKQAKDVYKAIIVMFEAQKQGIFYNPFDQSDLNKKKLEQIIQIGRQLFSDAKDETIKLFLNFARLYGVEYCPVYSVIGSVASQEFIKVIGKNQEPALNWFVYDSQEGYGKMENTQEIPVKKTDRPDLKRKYIPQD